LTEPDVEGGRRVLVVDDDADIREVMSAVLTDEGYRVSTAHDGAAALDRLRHGPRPDLILLDLMMPRMSGWELRAALAEDAALRSIPVVVVSADRGAGPKVAQLGVAGFLSKPVELEHLLSVVARSAG
jgi:two-component system, chemotaxis family, chemotaxis protein CheY